MSAKQKSDTYGAVDLGSNSFHMFVVRVAQNDLHIVDRLRERVRLAAGLDSNNHLTEEAEARALLSLERIGERLRDLPPHQVRAVGTDTLRRAHDSVAFLRRASKALGHQIQVIPDSKKRASSIWASHTPYPTHRNADWWSISAVAAPSVSWANASNRSKWRVYTWVVFPMA